MSSLKNVLSDLTQKGGVIAALVVSRDGFVIDGVKSDEVDLDALGALASSALLAWEPVGNELNIGAMEGVLVEFDSGPIASTFVNADAILVLMGTRLCNLGRIRIEMARAKEAVAACL
jgi:predicted regulator of Ras-like GTPase activity (Roadblock/LC7/MglB family)